MKRKVNKREPVTSCGLKGMMGLAASLGNGTEMLSDSFEVIK